MLAPAANDVDEAEDNRDEKEDEENLQREVEEYGADLKDYAEHGHGYDEHDGDNDPTKNLLYVHDCIIYYADFKRGGVIQPGTGVRVPSRGYSPKTRSRLR